ncbi:MAG: C25 family cysteine peptidase [Acidobacteriota bacterium]
MRFFLVLVMLATPPLFAAPKLYVAEPGVYEVGFEALAEAGLAGLNSIESLALTHLGDSLPLWVEDTDADGLFGPGDALRFLVPHRVFEAESRWLYTALPVLLLTTDGTSTAASPLPSEAEAQAEVHRVVRFEEDRVMATLRRQDVHAGVESLWYWATLSERTSSQQVVALGAMADRVEDASIAVRVRLLGWSEPEMPEGVAGHRMELFVVGEGASEEPVGVTEWDGRRQHDLQVSEVAAAPGSELRLKVPRRMLPDARDPLIDLVQLDWLEVRYPADRALADAGSPLMLATGDEPRWLSAEGSPADARIYADAGWSVRQSGGRWVVPPTMEAVELWVVGDEDLRSPVGIDTTTALPQLPDPLEYVMVAPPALVASAERLAAFHRERGLSVAVVSSHAIYDAYGGGQRGPVPIRAFLDSLGESLRFVLLVGEADWFLPGQTMPYGEETKALVPSAVRIAEFGLAASDHFYAYDADDDRLPRFAVGRFPAGDVTTLETLIDKTIRHAEAVAAVTTAAVSTPRVVMSSDRSPPSLGRVKRLLRTVEDAPIEIVLPAEDTGKDRDVVLIELLEAQPEVLYFGGHGARNMWQLGKRRDLDPESFFDKDDIERLPAADRLPIYLSISCGTAPFDHPSADSLGEVMLLAPDRGTVAFLGSGVALFTPHRFSDSLLRALAGEATLGEAVVRAKRQTESPQASHLYNLLGDPALPLR